jgi:hypothetical protein
VCRIAGATNLPPLYLDYLDQREFQQARPEAPMQAPYNRVVVLHATIVLGALLVQMFHSPLWALLFLIGLKISVELRTHLKERRRQQPAERQDVLP